MGPVRVLLLEDRPADAELNVAALREAGLDVEWECVEREQDFVAALGRGPDLVLSDYSMPQFDARRALAIIRDRQIDIPFIVVSGTIGEEVAVACMREGATDYLLKDRLGRLGASVRRAVEQHRIDLEMRRAKAEADRRRAEALRLAEIGRMLSQTLDSELVTRAVIEAVCRLLNARAAGIYRREPGGTGFVATTTTGSADGVFYWAPRVDAGEGLVGLAIRMERGVTSPDVLRDAVIRYGDDTRARLEQVTDRAGLAVPLRTAGRVFGALLIGDRSGRVFDADAIALAEAFADQASVAIRNAEMYETGQRELRERTRAEAALRSATEELAAIIDCSPLAVITYDPAMRVTSWNAAAEAMFGWQRDEAVGRALPGVAADQRDVVAALAARVRAAEMLRAVEVPLQRRGRVDVLTQVSVSPLHDTGGGVIGAVAMLEDITQRKQAETALRQGEKLTVMGSLLAGVAHELNNPLAVVLGHAQLLRSRVAGVPDLAARTEKLVQSAERCARVVRNFLALARQRPPERRAVALNEIVTESLELLAYSLRLDEVTVELDLGQEIPEFSADADQLGQVVINLVTNAAHAMRGTPLPHRLVIRTRYESDHVVLVVADSGPGIPAHVLPRIFEPFFTTKPTGQGTGLGLSLCQGFVESHGGRIAAENSREGGAILRIDLPVTAAAATAPAGVPPRSKKGRMLVVDDERDIADVLADVLRLDGHEVTVATSAREALAALREEMFDLVFTDVRMPDMDGLAFYREAVIRWPIVARRLVFVTGDTLSLETQAALHASGAPTLEKPFMPDDVRRVVARVLRADDA